jgi:lysophospholipase L1-like esterase
MLYGVEPHPTNKMFPQNLQPYLQETNKIIILKHGENGRHSQHLSQKLVQQSSQNNASHRAIQMTTNTICFAEL